MPELPRAYLEARAALECVVDPDGGVAALPRLSAFEYLARHADDTAQRLVDPRLKAGVRITLKGIPKREWIVMRVFRTEIEETLINRRWQVGGLV